MSDSVSICARVTKASRSRPGAVLVAVAALLATSAHAHAGVVATGNTLIGVFSNPILSGNVLNNPTVGVTTFFSNNGTAVAGGSGTNTLTWGTLDGQPQATGNYSSLTFNGATNLPLDSATPTQVGTLTFYNGTSSLDTLIFGATLSFYLNSVSPGTLLGSDLVYINTTSNQYGGTSLTPAQLQTDSDYLNICGNSSNICGSSIQSYESAEVSGYVPLRANLTATYHGDPDITLTRVSVDASTPNSGVIGTEPALSLPEPMSLSLLASGLVGLAFARRKRG